MRPPKTQIRPPVTVLDACWRAVGDACSARQSGSFVNGERVTGRRLRDGDELRFGNTAVSFFAPFESDDATRTTIG